LRGRLSSTGDEVVVAFAEAWVVPLNPAAEALADEERLRRFVGHVSADVSLLDQDMHHPMTRRHWLSDFGLCDRDQRA
jgi:hypothetical protein